MTTQPDSRTAAPTTRTGRWAMLIVLLLGQFMGLIDVFVVNVAAPGISRDLHTNGTGLQLIVGGYIVAYAVLLITGARLGAMFGNKAVFLFGITLFTLASVGCGLAPTVALLVVGRFAQGAGAAAMIPQVMSLIQTQFSGSDRARALSAYGVVLAAGSTVGLVVGGILISANLFGLHWRPVFFVNLPIGIAVLLLAPRFLPSNRRTSAVRMDVRGLLLGIAAVLLIVAPLVFDTAAGWPLWLDGCLPLGLLVGWLFLRFESRFRARGGAPLLNTSVFRSGGFASGLGTLAFMQVAYGGFLFVFTIYLELVSHDSAIIVAGVYLPMSITFGLCGYFWRRIPAGLQPFLAPVGMGICAVGYLWSTWAVSSGGSEAERLAALAVLGVGLGISVSPVITQSLASVAGPLAPDASGAVTTTVQLCQALGVAVLGALYFGSVQTNLSAGQTHGDTMFVVIGGVLAIASALAAGVSAPLVLRQRRLVSAG